MSVHFLSSDLHIFTLRMNHSTVSRYLRNMVKVWLAMSVHFPSWDIHTHNRTFPRCHATSSVSGDKVSVGGLEEAPSFQHLWGFQGKPWAAVTRESWYAGILPQLGAYYTGIAYHKYCELTARLKLI